MTNEVVKIKDFDTDNHIYKNIKLLVVSCEKKSTSKGMPYYDLLLQDNSGRINSKKWTIKDGYDDSILIPGQIVDFDLEVSVYQNKPQAKVIEVRSCIQENIEDYNEPSPVDVSKLKNIIKEAINGISNPTIATIVVAMLNKYEKDFYTYPAAKSIHHAHIGGLALHTCEMIEIGNFLCEKFDQINKDYLIGAIIIHDICKIIEIGNNNLGDYSLDGKLIGHISLLDGELCVIAKENKIDIDNDVDFKILRHMILSHHGKLEYGSPVMPLTLEAEILSQIDNLDAKINTISSALKNTKEGYFTDKIFSLDNRAFYKHK